MGEFDEPETERLTRPSDEEITAARVAGLAADCYKWAIYNFGDNTKNPPYRCVFGMIEEIEELEEALSTHNREKLLDAAADTMLYMFDYYSRNGWDVTPISDIISMARANNLFTDHSVLGTIRRLLSRHQLKKDQGIRGTPAEHDKVLKGCCESLTRICAAVVKMVDSDLLACVECVWNETVSKRDWVENPMDAAQKVEEAKGQVVS